MTATAAPAAPHGVTTAVVPAAGWGTRMRPLTDAVPKELLPLGRRAALQWIVSELAAVGITGVVFVVSPAKEALIRRVFGDQDTENDLRFAYAVQTEMRGLGDALLCAEPHVPEGKPFLVALGDAVIGESSGGGLTRRLLSACATAGPDSLGLAVQRVPRERLSRYGVVRPASPISNAAGAFFAIDGIIEKPSPEDAPSEYAAAARYCLPPAVFDTLRATPPDAKGEVQLTDALRSLLAGGHPGVAVPLTPEESRYDIGSFDSYYRAFATFALNDPGAGKDLRHYLINNLSDYKESSVE